jgi:hypothetical protein
MRHAKNPWVALFLSLPLAVSSTSTAWSSQLSLETFTRNAGVPGVNQYGYEVTVNGMETVAAGDRISVTKMLGVTSQDVAGNAATAAFGSWQNTTPTATSAAWDAGGKAVIGMNWGSYLVRATTDPGTVSYSLGTTPGGSGTVRGPLLAAVPPPPPPPAKLGPPVPAPEMLPAPREGAMQAGMTFNAGTGSLSFTGSISFANLKNSTIFDNSFANDPTINATVQVTGLHKVGPSGAGFLFSGGTLTISNGGITFFAAGIPNLLIGDGGSSALGFNILAPLNIGQLGGLIESPFTNDYLNFWSDNMENIPPVLYGETAIPVDSLIGSNTSFATTVSGFGPGFLAVPEPAAFTLLSLGIIGVLGCSWYRRKRTAA